MTMVGAGLPRGRGKDGRGVPICLMGLPLRFHPHSGHIRISDLGLELCTYPKADDQRPKHRGLHG